MPHLHRFYAAPEADNPDVAILRDDEAHHAMHVVRLRTGDTVEIFDGIGRSWTGKVANLSRSAVTLNVSDARIDPVPSTELTLALGWLHRDKAIEEVVRRCTELGVGGFVFFRAERSERAPKLTYKLARQAVESCKQCGRNRLPGIMTIQSLDGVLSQTEGALLVATRDLAPTPLAAGLAGRDKAVLFVGPEGDFTGNELKQLLDAGGAPISFGERTLRSEVAAVTACTLALYELGQLGPQRTITS